MRQHIGSTVAMILGVLSLLSGITNPGPILISGIVILLGAIAYRSAKNRKLGRVRSTKLRMGLEISAIVGAVLIVVLQSDFLMSLERDPANNLIIPLWVVVAYTAVFFWKPKIIEGETDETAT
tara:strand:- start:163 stop:531 length:369 start_codon:yes stop_codon:yes gene_type:complete